MGHISHIGQISKFTNTDMTYMTYLTSLTLAYNPGQHQTIKLAIVNGKL